MANNSGILLQMKNITKDFPGVRALDSVSLTVKKGSVHALMGENGAGKSTLMKCLFGIYSADSGEVYLEGDRVNFKNPNDALQNGVAMVHQELNQATKRNVMDNIWLGRYPTRLGADFVISVGGDSMEPTYHDSDKVFVEKCDAIDVGEVGIFVVNGDVYIKELGNKCLISHNEKYKPIRIGESDSVYCCGRVIGIVE